MPDPDFISPDAYLGRDLPADTERAWAAGFFDGEGWIGVTHTKGHTYLKMAVVQTGSTATLDRFNAAIGGVGRTYARSSKQPENWTPGWVLQVNAIASVVFATNMIWPYLSAPKRQQAIVAFRKRAEYRSTWPLEFRTTKQRLSEDDVREIRRLCQAGVRRIEIATQFGLHVTSVSHIKSGKLRGDVR